MVFAVRGGVRLKKIIMWILVLSWMGLIFFFSSQPADESSTVSRGFVYEVIKFFDFSHKLPDSKIMKTAEDINGIIRKVAHFSIYAVLGFLLFYLIHEYTAKKYIILSSSPIIALIYAISDEFHQTFIDGRSGEIRDVLIDTSGAITGIIFALLLLKIYVWFKERVCRNGVY